MRYDDGHRDGWLQGRQESYIAVRFSLGQLRTIREVRYFLGGEMRPVRFILWNGAWQELYSQILSPSAPSGGDWWSWQIPAGAVAPQAEVYVGFQCLSDYSDGPWGGLDSSDPDGQTNAGPWPPARRTDGDAMIRVVVW